MGMGVSFSFSFSGGVGHVEGMDMSFLFFFLFSRDMEEVKAIYTENSYFSGGVTEMERIKEKN